MCAECITNILRYPISREEIYEDKQLEKMRKIFTDSDKTCKNTK